MEYWAYLSGVDAEILTSLVTKYNLPYVDGTEKLIPVNMEITDPKVVHAKISNKLLSTWDKIKAKRQ